MFILTTEKKLRDPKYRAMLGPGETWEECVWPNLVRNDSWASILKRNPPQPWQHMSALYGRHEGETVIITGSGPSILPAVETLKKTKHPIMAINRSVKLFPATYLCVHDKDAAEELWDHPNAGEKIVNCQLAEYYPGKPLYAIEAIGSPTRYPLETRPLYWNNITLGWAIHLALRMGAKRIVTIGCDLSVGAYDGFLQPGKDMEWLTAQHYGTMERTLEMFAKDKQEWYERDVEILDASGGKMPCPQVKLEDVL